MLSLRGRYYEGAVKLIDKKGDLDLEQLNDFCINNHIFNHKKYPFTVSELRNLTEKESEVYDYFKALDNKDEFKKYAYYRISVHKDMFNPFPTIGKEYSYLWISSDNELEIKSKIMNEDTLDYYLLSSGNCFYFNEEEIEDIEVIKQYFLHQVRDFFDNKGCPKSNYSTVEEYRDRDYFEGENE